MARPKILFCTLATLTVFTFGVNGLDANIIGQLTKLPACGMKCFTSVIGSTPCGITDAACICTDDTFRSLAQDCVLANCKMRDALEVMKVEAGACERPIRSQKGTLLSPVSIEAPAWFCPWIRLYSRYLTLGRWEIDDWIMLVTGLLYTVFLVLGQYTGYMAFGVDIWTLDPAIITQALKQFYIDESFYVLPLGLAKVSVLCFYLRIFPGRHMRYSILGAMGLVLIPTLVFLFLQIFQCWPIHYVWDGWMDGGTESHCLDLHTVTFTAAGFSILQDLVILIIPLPSLYRLQMDSRAKWGIMLMFSLGVFITITSCIRLRYIIVFDRTMNPTWDYVQVLIWTGIELAVAIIVACLPAIGVLLKRVVPWIIVSMSSSYGRHNSTAAGSQDFRGGNNYIQNALDAKPRRIFPFLTRDGRDSDSQTELGLEDYNHSKVSTVVSGNSRDPEVDSREGVVSRAGTITIKTTTTVRTSSILEDTAHRGSS